MSHVALAPRATGVTFGTLPRAARYNRGVMGRFWLLAGLLGGALGASAAACSDDSNAPTGKGDTVTYTDATMQPQQSMTDASEDYSFFAMVDSGYPGAPDGYSPYALCQKCGCPKTEYCFGGGTGYTSFNGICDGGGDAFALGCQPIPAACVADASCECLIESVSNNVPCFPVCVQNSLTVYCPNP